VLFGQNLIVNSSKVTFNGTLAHRRSDDTDIKEESSVVIRSHKDVIFAKSSGIEAGSIFVYAAASINAQEGFHLTSYQNNTCTE
jgi:hypothetical protein